MVAGSTVLLCLAITLVRISSTMEHLSPSCTDCHTSLHPDSLHQPYWLTEYYWDFSLPTYSLYKLQIGATGFLLDSWTLRMGPIGCTETSVRNYHYLLCNNSEERSSQVPHSGSLTSRIASCYRPCNSGPGSSVGIVNDYGLDDPGTESRWRRDFLPVQTSPGAHPASCTTGTRSFPGVKCGGGMLLTTHPFLVLRSWKSRAIPLPPSGPKTGL
jgi:hypothetical protein